MESIKTKCTIAIIQLYCKIKYYYYKYYYINNNNNSILQGKQQ